MLFRFIEQSFLIAKIWSTVLPKFSPVDYSDISSFLILCSYIA